MRRVLDPLARLAGEGWGKGVWNPSWAPLAYTLFRNLDSGRVAVDVNHLSGSQRLGQSERDRVGPTPAIEESHPLSDVRQEERGLVRYPAALEIFERLGVMDRHAIARSPVASALAGG